MKDTDINELVARLREKYGREDELFSKIAEVRMVKTVPYVLLLDTYNIFMKAHDALKPFFDDYNAKFSEEKNPLRPNLNEYVEFAHVFIKTVKENFEKQEVLKYKEFFSERQIRKEIKKLLSQEIKFVEFPNAQSIVSFKSDVYLFGSKFDESYHLGSIERRIESAKEKSEIRKLEELKNQVKHEKQVNLGYSIKNFKFYNEFLDSLRDREDKEKMPGFYKFFIKNGMFSRHTEKGVDTSLAVKSISLAFEQPDHIQIFCIADTDYIPVFEKLDDLGVSFIIFYVGNDDSFPWKEFGRFRTDGRLIMIQFSEICSMVISCLTDRHLHGGDLYERDNASAYKHFAEYFQNKLWDEVMAEMGAAMAKEAHQHYEKEKAEFERFIADIEDS
jgi:hypothetical protein